MFDALSLLSFGETVNAFGDSLPLARTKALSTL